MRRRLLASLLLFSVFVVGLAGAGCSSEAARHKAAGNVLFKQGDLDGALREYRAALAAQPSDPNAHTLMANALFEKSEWAEARREFESALKLDPSARAALQGLAMLELRQDHAAQAAALYQRMIDAQPRDGEAHAALGKLQFAAGDLDGAERNLRDSLVSAQNDRAALYTLGLVLAKKKQPEQANAIFDRLESAAPNRAYAPYGRAVAAAAAGQDDEALRLLTVAFARGVDDPDEVEREPSFARLQKDPRFVALVAAARARK